MTRTLPPPCRLLPGGYRFLVRVGDYFARVELFVCLIRKETTMSEITNISIVNANVPPHGEPTSPDDTVRLVIALNKSLEFGKALNAASHLAAGITNLIGQEGRDRLKFLDFRGASDGMHLSISARSFIVLRANSNELRKLRTQADEGRFLCTDFIATMTGGTYKEQLERTAATAADQIEYCGVALFGLRADLDPLTRKLSLWR